MNVTNTTFHEIYPLGADLFRAVRRMASHEANNRCLNFSKAPKEDKIIK